MFSASLSRASGLGKLTTFERTWVLWFRILLKLWKVAKKPPLSHCSRAQAPTQIPGSASQWGTAGKYLDHHWFWWLYIFPTDVSTTFAFTCPQWRQIYKENGCIKKAKYKKPGHGTCHSSPAQSKEYRTRRRPILYLAHRTWQAMMMSRFLEYCNLQYLESRSHCAGSNFRWKNVPCWDILKVWCEESSLRLQELVSKKNPGELLRKIPFFISDSDFLFLAFDLVAREGCCSCTVETLRLFCQRHIAEK